MIFDFRYVAYVLIPTLLIAGAVQLHLRSAYAGWRGARRVTGRDRRARR